MTVAAYRDRASGRYPITLDEVRGLVPMLFGAVPEQPVLDAANVDPVQATALPAYDPTKQMVTEGAPARSGGSWRQTWTVSALPSAPIDPYAHFVPTPLFRQRAEAAGVWQDFASYLAQNPAQMLKVLTLERGIDPADVELNAGMDDMRIPADLRAQLLAPPE